MSYNIVDSMFKYGVSVSLALGLCRFVGSEMGLQIRLELKYVV